MSTPPKRTILLFGKTGDGKSTVANMLTTGDVDGEFATGDSSAAVTKQTNELTTKCGNWTIIDTVGMFATDTPEHDLRSTREMRNYLSEKQQAIDVFCYVKKATKFTRADEQCWRAFHALFADNGENQHYHDSVLLVFTSCRKGWLDENMNLISDMMSTPVLPNPNTRDDIVVASGSQRFRYRSIAVDFPPHDDDPVVESKLEKTRLESLDTLKSALQKVEQPLPLCKLPGNESTHGSKIRGILGGCKKIAGVVGSICAKLNWFPVCLFGMCAIRFFKCHRCDGTESVDSVHEDSPGRPCLGSNGRFSSNEI